MSVLLGREFSGQRVAVIGLAATGVATAKVLRDLGAMVTVFDSKPEAKLDPARVAEVRNSPGISLVSGTDEPDWSYTDLIVPSPGVPRYAPVLVEAQKRKVSILSEIEIAYRLAHAPILAITGTNGKTTTTALLGAICKKAGKKTWIAGNIAEDEGKRLPLIQAAVEAPVDGVIVAEISSFQLEWVEQFRPYAAAWLNITNDHLDRHKDLDEYARAKANIFRAQTADDWAIFNADDKTVLKYAEGVGYGTRWRFSLNGDPGGEDAVAYLKDNKTLMVDDGDGALTLMSVSDIALPGRHNISNVLAASAMALAFGIDRRDIREAVRAFKGVAHRMEYVGEVYGIHFINNSMCTNPAAVDASVSAVETPLVAIVGGIHKGGDLSGMAKTLAEKARRIVLIGQSAQEIADALTAQEFTDFSFSVTMNDAVTNAAEEARPGDTVMLVPGCASFDMFTGFEQRGQAFRDAVRALSNTGTNR